MFENIRGKMFENIGGKVKSLAFFMAVVGIAASVIIGIAIWISGIRGAFLTGLLYLVIGSLSFWIGSWALYAIGRAAEVAELNNALLAEMYKKMNSSDKEEQSAYTPIYHKDEDARRHSPKSGYDVG